MLALNDSQPGQVMVLNRLGQAVVQENIGWGLWLTGRMPGGQGDGLSCEDVAG
ncbi:MAG: hypothetical protein RJA69_324 [Pseudomonadota bacterium]|jgi:hypothetical protein